MLKVIKISKIHTNINESKLSLRKYIICEKESLFVNTKSV